MNSGDMTKAQELAQAKLTQLKIAAVLPWILGAAALYLFAGRRK